ncbi:MAG: TetR/AcrR family transcriptional regulator [Mycolicibacterium fortuitum]|uniref:TetR family transcriptional regulator n=1 Tax=Mycolicibacterium fortuitum TaxID=1766 RepID=A0ABD6QJS3_MYCFO|nr:TetR/AcrR family transcriptional regulator [Mycolicibacterium fortuitum]OMC01829.1 TetR family transcriptional regulator [Mycolicibacterium fortuitum]OMC41679.1 TetR family transcriptional regulator [Mycolicibacterium fortuitum]
MSDSAVTRRSKAKSDRRSQLIAAAERLIAERGYLAVRLEDICSAVGISGPAIYRHFPNKEALLVELLVGISTRLLAGAQRVTAATEDPAESLNGLVDFHLDFVFGEPDLIRIQDRDLAHLPDAARRQVRRSQRQYVEIWVAVLTQLNRDLAEEDARVMAHAVFGLLNSTPYSARPAVPKAHSRALLRRMTLAALTAS